MANKGTGIREYQEEWNDQEDSEKGIGWQSKTREW